jgi:predicted porin
MLTMKKQIIMLLLFSMGASIFFVLLGSQPRKALAADLVKGDWLVHINGALRVSYNEEDCNGECQDQWHHAGSSPAPDSASGTYLAGDISQVGISGIRRMDSGIKALFMTEWRIDTPDGDNQEIFSNFEQYLGLDGPFGLIRAGIIETPYMQTGKMIDPFTSDALSTRFFVDIQSALHHTNGKGRGRATNTIRYDSPPSASGFGFQAFYSIDNSKDNDHGYGTGITYTSQGSKLFAQYYDNGESGDDEAYKFGGSVGSERFMVFGQYEFDNGLISLAENLSSLSSESVNTAEGDNTYESNGTTGADVWYVGIIYSTGKVRLIYEYGERKDSSNGRINKDGHTSWLVGISASLDKNFYVYAGYLEKEYNAGGQDKDTRYTLGATLTF